MINRPISITIWKGGVVVPVLEFTQAEVKTLVGVLLVEQGELDNLIKTSSNSADKKELEEELKRVNSILQKCRS